MSSPGESRAFRLDLAGQEWLIETDERSLDRVHRPYLRCINARARAKGGRFIVFVAGPPGSGKTTLCALWESLARELPGALPIQTLPLDGFHFRNEQLERMGLRSRKGCPETFDAAMVQERLQTVRANLPVRWPYYDRKLHEPVDDAIEVIPAGIVQVEGNYLLLDEPPWRDLAAFADFTVFIESSEATLEDAFQRFLRGGRLYDEALRHHRLVDLANYGLVMGKRKASEVTLVVGDDRRIEPRGAFEAPAH